MHVIARAVRPVAIPSIFRGPLYHGIATSGFALLAMTCFFDTFGVGGCPKRKPLHLQRFFPQQNGKKQIAPGQIWLHIQHRHRLVQGFILRSKPWKFPA